MLVWLDGQAEAADGGPGQRQDEQPVCNVWIPRHAGDGKKEEDGEEEEEEDDKRQTNGSSRHLSADRFRRRLRIAPALGSRGVYRRNFVELGDEADLMRVGAL